LNNGPFFVPTRYMSTVSTLKKSLMNISRLLIRKISQHKFYIHQLTYLSLMKNCKVIKKLMRSNNKSNVLTFFL
jgi:hypothetical protein